MGGSALHRGESPLGSFLRRAAARSPAARNLVGVGTVSSLRPFVRLLPTTAAKRLHRADTHQIPPQREPDGCSARYPATTASKVVVRESSLVTVSPPAVSVCVS